MLLHSVAMQEYVQPSLLSDVMGCAGLEAAHSAASAAREWARSPQGCRAVLVSFDLLVQTEFEFSLFLQHAAATLEIASSRLASDICPIFVTYSLFYAGLCLGVYLRVNEEQLKDSLIVSVESMTPPFEVQDTPSPEMEAFLAAPYAPKLVKPKYAQQITQFDSAQAFKSAANLLRSCNTFELARVLSTMLTAMAE